MTAPEPEVLEAVRARDALRGRQVKWAEGSGIAEGIDDAGRLLVVNAQGNQIALGAGEVHLTW
jgi:BirA family biotin operon repressor/biotin-[acetyl-CoA-carboxylase] ligase